MIMTLSFKFWGISVILVALGRYQTSVESFLGSNTDLFKLRGVYIVVKFAQEEIIASALVTFPISRLLKSKLVKDLQEENIPYISVTFWVSKLVTSK